MISVGACFGGPECTLARTVITAAMQLLRDGVEDSDAPRADPTVNIVFRVDGSIAKMSTEQKVYASTFSRKRNLLLVNIPVSVDQVNKIDIFDEVFDGCVEACRIAKEVFMRRAMIDFDLESALKKVEESRLFLRACLEADGWPRVRHYKIHR